MVILNGTSKARKIHLFHRLHSLAKHRVFNTQHILKLSMVHAIKQLSDICIKPPYGARSSPAMGE